MQGVCSQHALTAHKLMRSQKQHTQGTQNFPGLHVAGGVSKMPGCSHAMLVQFLMHDAK